MGVAGRKVVAVMQPYFAAYPGYYRLLAAADLFVIYDCVQFPRRGWVHRNRAPDTQGEAAWLTLPLRPAAFDARIDSLEFAQGAAGLMAGRLRTFPSLANLGPTARSFLEARPFAGLLVDYLEAQLAMIASMLPNQVELQRSSALHLPAALRGQDRILEICRRVGASDYVNAPGGVDLYDAASFASAGIRLHFLPPWTGAPHSILHALAISSPDRIAAAIWEQTPDYRA